MDLNSISLLIPKSIEGDSHAREELLVQIQEYLVSTAERNMDPSLRQKIGTSDIVQQSFLRVIEKFESFRGSTSPEFHAWLKSIVVNEIKNTRRSYRTRKRDLSKERGISSGDSLLQNIQIQDPNLTPSSEAISSERIEKFHEVLEQLSPAHAEVIRLRNMQRLPFAEIAKTMGRSEEAVSKLWYRAVLKFEEKLKLETDFETN